MEKIVNRYWCPKCGEIFDLDPETDKFNCICPKCENTMRKYENLTINPDLKQDPVYITKVNGQYITAPECPYCHKNNTHKISGIGRWVSSGLFGLGSSKVGKQWHCNNCGSDF